MSRPLLEGFTFQIRTDYYVSVLIIDELYAVFCRRRDLRAYGAAFIDLIYLAFSFCMLRILVYVNSPSAQLSG
jgi:hypothetical protein